MRDLDDQAQVRTNHQRPRFAITFFNFRCQLDLLLRSQEGDLPDLAQVNLNSGIAILSSHITLFHQSFGGFESTTFRTSSSSQACRSRVLTSWQVVNKVKYSE